MYTVASTKLHGATPGRTTATISSEPKLKLKLKLSHARRHLLQRYWRDINAADCSVHRMHG